MEAQVLCQVHGTRPRLRWEQGLLNDLNSWPRKEGKPGPLLSPVPGTRVVSLAAPCCRSPGARAAPPGAGRTGGPSDGLQERSPRLLGQQLPFFSHSDACVKTEAPV